MDLDVMMQLGRETDSMQHDILRLRRARKMSIRFATPIHSRGLTWLTKN